MTPAAAIDLDDSYARALDGLYVPWQPAPVPEPRLVACNRPLARELGLDPAFLESPAGIAVVSGNEIPAGASPLAMAYAGHQFGGYSPRLGDGRALLLGEVVAGDGTRRDIHLKGSGRTPFARGGDGKAVLGPMLREYLVAEAMHALGIPTTRALAVVATGEAVGREGGAVPGAVLTRVAASHLRVGTFEYAARLEDRSVLPRLLDYAIARHHPQVDCGPDRAMGLLDAVIDAQSRLVAQWMLVGFVHGVMNTDNMTISGEGIDYGPCAFMDRHDPATVYSSIDHGGRYAYGNQPVIAQWNLARLAETLLVLVDGDRDAAVADATARLDSFTDRYRGHWLSGMRAKLGLPRTDEDRGVDVDVALIDDFWALLAAHRADHTGGFRALGACVRGDTQALHAVFDDPPASAPLGAWIGRWTQRLEALGTRSEATAAAMDAVNPVHVPRNHLVEEALAAAHQGDLEPFAELLAVVTDPYRVGTRPDRFAGPAPDEFDRGYRTFCGT